MRIEEQKERNKRELLTDRKRVIERKRQRDKRKRTRLIERESQIGRKRTRLIERESNRKHRVIKLKQQINREKIQTELVHTIT